MKNFMSYVIMNIGWLKIGNKILKRINLDKNDSKKA